MPTIGSIIGMLDRDGALHLDDVGEYGSWPEADETDSIYPIDFDSLGADAQDFSSPNSDFVEQPVGIRVDEQVVEAVLNGPDTLRGRDNAVPPPDVLGWYQPIHFFAGNWGIFIRESALVALARDLAPRFEPFAGRRGTLSHVAVLLRSAFSYVFLHEQYHHKIESLAIRLHVIERRPVYPPYMRFITTVAGTENDYEEAVANADAWLRLDTLPYSNWFARDERRVIQSWMLDLFENSPPPYKPAVRILTGPSPRDQFSEAEDRLTARVQEARLFPTRADPADFATTTHLTQSLFNIRQSLWSVVPAGNEPMLPRLPGALPLQSAKLERYITKNGWEIVRGAGKGSHAKFRNNRGEMIVLSHNKDVSRQVLDSTARTLGIKPQRLIELAR